MNTTAQGSRVMGPIYQRFLAFQVIGLMLSLSISEEGNALVYSIKILSTAMPFLSCCGLLILSRGVEAAFSRSFYTFRFVWLLGGMATVGCLWAADSPYSASKVFIFLLTFSALTCTLVQYEFVDARERADVLGRHILYACFVLLGVMVMNYFVFHIGGGDSDRHRAGGNLVAPTNAAATVGLSLLIALHFTVRMAPERKNPRLRAIALATFVMSVWALLVLSTRSAFVCVVVALFLAPILNGGFRLTYRRLFSAVTLFSVAAFTAANMHLLGSLLSRDMDTTSVWALSGRTWLWARVFEDWTILRAFSGYGFAAISEERGVRDWWTGETMFAGAHNAYLQVLFGLGIFGLLFYLGFLRSFLRAMRVKHRAFVPAQHALRIAIFIYFAMFSMTEHLFGLNVTPAFFLVCCVLASSRYRTIGENHELRSSSRGSHGT
ncbi:MAG: O-antigen ligase [Bacteroidia bacterium]|jgi:O-antigen ligase